MCAMGSLCPTFWVLWWRCGPDRSDGLRWAAATQRPGEDRKSWGILVWQVNRGRKELYCHCCGEEPWIPIKCPWSTKEKCAFIFLLINFNVPEKTILIQNLPHHNGSAVPWLQKCRFFALSAKHVYVSPHIYWGILHWKAQVGCRESWVMLTSKRLSHRENGLILSWRQRGSWNSSPPDYSSIIHQHKKSLS